MKVSEKLENLKRKWEPILKASRRDFFTMHNIISKVFGIFPLLQMGCNNILRFCGRQFLTSWATALALISLPCLLDSLTAMTFWCTSTQANCTLSEIIQFYPPTIASSVSDIMIRFSAIFYSINYISITHFLRQWYPKGERMTKMEKIFYVGKALNASYAVVRFIRLNVNYWGGDIFTTLCGRNGSCEDYPGFRAFLLWLDFWHQGAVLSATAFVAIYGLRLVRVLKKICRSLKVKTASSPPPPVDHFMLTWRTHHSSKPGRVTKSKLF